MLEENLQDSGEIVQNILQQPLTISGSKTPEISLLVAAQHFNTHDALASDLRKILLSFLQFKEPTEQMLQELDLIVEELEATSS